MYYLMILSRCYYKSSKFMVKLDVIYAKICFILLTPWPIFYKTSSQHLLEFQQLWLFHCSLGANRKTSDDFDPDRPVRVWRSSCCTWSCWCTSSRPGLWGGRWGGRWTSWQRTRRSRWQSGMKSRSSFYQAIVNKWRHTNWELFSRL